jgi:hypothetical protein
MERSPPQFKNIDIKLQIPNFLVRTRFFGKGKRKGDKRKEKKKREKVTRAIKLGRGSIRGKKGSGELGGVFLEWI